MTVDESVALQEALVKHGRTVSQLMRDLTALKMLAEEPVVVEFIGASRAKNEAVVLLQEVEGCLAKAVGLIALVHPE